MSDRLSRHVIVGPNFKPYFSGHVSCPTFSIPLVQQLNCLCERRPAESAEMALVRRQLEIFSCQANSRIEAPLPSSYFQSVDVCSTASDAGTGTRTCGSQSSCDMQNQAGVRLHEGVTCKLTCKLFFQTSQHVCVVLGLTGSNLAEMWGLQ